MLDAIQLSTVIPASPEQVYRAWLDPGEHTAFTGGSATCEPWIGGRYTAWGGYIEGKTLALEPGRRIVQSWRTSDFPPGSGDSRLELVLEKATTGTCLVLNHSDIPAGQGAMYREGWQEHYLGPMLRYFSSAEPHPVVSNGAGATEEALQELIGILADPAEAPTIVVPLPPLIPKEAQARPARAGRSQAKKRPPQKKAPPKKRVAAKKKAAKPAAKKKVKVVAKKKSPAKKPKKRR